MTASTPTKLGHYKIHSQIGEGGMGKVYLAEDTTESDRLVAIKLLPADIASDQRRLRRFLQEAKTVSSLNHPNLLTFYDFGQQGGTLFIATEYVEGITLREYLRSHKLTLQAVLDIAIQIAEALDAAHNSFVAHRDIKPENIVVRHQDALVKVLDFGLARAATRSIPDTPPGVVLGTVSYMSPEQSDSTKRVDYRTDIWSLGVVLYEMITGHVPFEGKDVHRQIIAIQEQQPLPLSTFAEGLPERLEEIVAKTLAKNPDDRYQSARDLLTDLRELRSKLEVDVDIVRTDPPDLPVAKTSGNHERLISRSVASGAYPQSSAEYIVNQVKLHKRVTVMIVAVFLLAGAIALTWHLTHRRAALLTDKDTILLTEFDNQTGEEVFDKTLRQGLAVQLQQSPFLDIFPDQRIRATLQLMSLSPDERVTRERAREICQRQGLKAFIAGSIVKFDRNYSITLEALNGQTGDSLALVQVEAEGKDQVLKALSRAASEMRQKLGESLSSIQKFDAKLEVTTASLDALKEYALGRSEQDKGQFLKAIAFYKGATEKDPNFAVAWLGLALQYSNTGQPALAAENAEKAFNLREHASEAERARITYFYYQIATGELDKAIEEQEAYARNYPREARGPGNLGNLYSSIGQYDKAVVATSEALRLNPNTTIWPGNLAEALLGLNRFAEAKDVCERAIAQKLDSTSIRERLYAVAFVYNDLPALQAQIAWASGRADEYRAVNWQTQTAAFGGEWRKSEEHLRRATELALRSQAKEVAASYTADEAVRAAWLGLTSRATAMGEAALKLERNRRVLTSAALAFALSGEASRAQSLIAELEQKFPKDTRVNQLWIPQIKAALELQKGDAEAVFDLLEPARRYEPAAEFGPQTLRVMAYLKVNKGAEAAAEARKIIDHRGEGPLSLLWPLAQLNFARASVMQGDTRQARESYESFFALWNSADPEIPILIEAKKEYEKLKLQL
ncbi:MAG TPA: protein kinase [Pyrinomonadaceae bacterium]